MGILDDAIREHLDLKRQHGADDSEVKQLEDEAFGPPTRPGEPDFPESEEQQALGGDQPAGDGPGEAGKGPQADQGAEDATALLDTTAPAPEPAVGQAAEPAPEQPSEPAPEPVSDTGMEPAPPPAVEPTPDPPAPELPPAEPESIEQPVLDEPAAEDTGAFNDQGSEAELDMDELDLDLDDEDASDLMGEEEEAGPDAALPPEPAQPISEEHPIETLETVEHPLEEPLEEEPPITGDEPVAEGDSDSEDDDVLEGTPEFLRDQPEDDELWFEQGEPKDFDF